jgi:hypothetical protein
MTNLTTSSFNNFDGVLANFSGVPTNTPMSGEDAQEEHVGDERLK